MAEQSYEDVVIQAKSVDDPSSTDVSAIQPTVSAVLAGSQLATSPAIPLNEGSHISLARNPEKSEGSSDSDIAGVADKSSHDNFVSLL